MADFIDKAKHKAEELAGSAKETVGDVTGNKDLEAEGASDQAGAKVKQGVDSVTDAAEDAADTAKDVAADVADTAKHKADVADTAKHKADDVADAVKDTAADVKDTANEVADIAKDKAKEFKADVQNFDSADVTEAVSDNRWIIAGAAAVVAGLVTTLVIRRRNRKKVASLSDIFNAARKH